VEEGKKIDRSVAGSLTEEIVRLRDPMGVLPSEKEQIWGGREGGGRREEEEQRSCSLSWVAGVTWFVSVGAGGAGVGRDLSSQVSRPRRTREGGVSGFFS
jgi:hypothetical protein